MTVTEMLAALKSRGLSFVHIGKKLQVTPITVQRWAHGEFDPRYQQGKSLEGLYQSVMTEVAVDNGNEKAQNVRDENKDTP